MANEKSIFKKLICPYCKKWQAAHTGKEKGDCCGKPMYLSDNWHVRLTKGGRTFIKSVSPRRKDAEDLIHSVKDTIRQKKLLPWEEETISWTVARAEFVAWSKTLAPNSQRFYDVNLRNLEKMDLGVGVKFPDLDMQDIEPKHLKVYRDTRLAQVSSKTTHSEMGTLNRMFTVALESRSARTSPILHAAHVDLQKVKLPELNNEKTRYLDVAGISTLLESIGERAPHLKLIVIIGIKTTLRKTNILSLRRSQIDLDNKTITIQREQMKSKKKDGDHIVPIDDELAGLLKDWIVQNKCFDYLFPSPKDPQKHLTNISTGWYNALESAGVNNGYSRPQDKITFNVATRHTGATLALEHSDDIFSVSKLLDHSSVTITEKKYAKKVAKKVAAVVEAFGDAVRLVK